MYELFLFVLGVVIGWGINHYYASKSDRQLRADAEKVERNFQAVQDQLLVIGRAFAQLAEDRQWVEWARDADGKITFGRVIRVAYSDSVDATASLHMQGYPPTVSQQKDPTAPDISSP